MLAKYIYFFYRMRLSDTFCSILLGFFLLLLLWAVMFIYHCFLVREVNAKTRLRTDSTAYELFPTMDNYFCINIIHFCFTLYWDVFSQPDYFNVFLRNYWNERVFFFSFCTFTATQRRWRLIATLGKRLINDFKHFVVKRLKIRAFCRFSATQLIF